MNKSEILEKAKNHTLKSKKVWVEDWQSDVFVKQMNAKQYIDVSTDSLDADKKEIDQTKFLNLAIIRCTYDLNGEQIFDNDDLDTILNMTADGYSGLILAVSELNNMDGSAGNSNPKNSKKIH